MLFEVIALKGPSPKGSSNIWLEPVDTDDASPNMVSVPVVPDGLTSEALEAAGTRANALENGSHKEPSKSISPPEVVDTGPFAGTGGAAVKDARGSNSSKLSATVFSGGGAGAAAGDGGEAVAVAGAGGGAVVGAGAGTVAGLGLALA